MQYISRYASPLGEILLAADEAGLTGLWFAGQKYFARGLDAAAADRETPVIAQAKQWLDGYFAGRAPAVSYTHLDVYKRQGLGFWNTMPTRLRSRLTSQSR